LGVEIVRGGRGYAPVAEPEAAHPNIVFISNSALAGQDIANLLSRFHAQNAAVVLCVEAVEGPRAHTGDPIAQAHIDLLSVEQNAWMIAAYLDHCDVVATRTELDWAIKNNRLAIWAPTKMVMDATDTFESYAPASLAIWLGQELDAKSCSLIGAETMDGVNSLPSINDFDISALRR
jgi:dihydroneopterin aldolase